MKMNYKLLLLIAFVMAGFMLTGCGSGSGGNSDEADTYEIALITDTSDESEGSFSASAWAAIENFGQDYGPTTAHYKVDINDASSEEDIRDATGKTVDEAIGKGAKLIVFAGGFFETAVHSAQQEHEDIYFILIDGVPRDDEHNYELAGNSTGVLFAEEEAGFLAGYAAVFDGYNRLGFIGGEELPPVKRFGYGFIQGITYAAKEKGVKDIEVKYTYTGTFNAEDWIRKGADRWYSDGTQVIFACGGSIGKSVAEATGKGNADEEASEETQNRWMIGVDTDQSGLSNAVITSAKKEIKTAIFDILKTYIHDNFKGNSIFNYNIKNRGVSLEMVNSRFTKFNSEDYTTIVDEIKAGNITINKDMGSKSLKDMATDGIKVTEDKIEK